MATHMLDATVYAAAAGYYKGVFYLKDPQQPKRKPAAAAPHRHVKPAARSAAQRRRKPGGPKWLDNLPTLE